LARKTTTYTSSDGPNRGITKQRETPTYWRREAERNRPAADALIALGGGTAPLEYLGVLGAAQYVATHGVTHSQGGYVMGVGHPAAQALVRAEQRYLAQRARILLPIFHGWRITRSHRRLVCVRTRIQWA
jgi:hypothetical protein